MKQSSRAWLLSLVIAASAVAIGHSQSESPIRVEIKAMPKKDSKDKERSGNVVKGEKSFQYSVTVANRAFRDATGLTAEYLVFIRRDSGKGSKTNQKVEKKTFKLEIPTISKHGEFSFDTEPVMLRQAQLDAGWYYTDGTRSRIEDKPEGLWLRVMQDGKVVGEYVNPTSLKSQQSFD